MPPRFVPLGSAAVKGESMGVDPSVQADWVNRYGVGGVIGGVLAGFYIASVQDDIADTTNQRCMGFKGYSRTSITSATWYKIARGTDAERLARLAVIASDSQLSAAPVKP